jgi:hypothetical protein
MDPRNKKHSGTPQELLRTEFGRAANVRLHGLGVDFLFGMLLRYCFDLTGGIKAAVPRQAALLLTDSKGNSKTTSDLLLHRRKDDAGEDEDDDDDDDDNRLHDDGEGVYDEGPYYTIALHSRHIDEALDGCDISREIDCVNELLKVKMPKGKQCAVVLMSDRACTLLTLLPWLEERGCRAFVARHDSRTDYLTEHGPFAGVGFFQDLALASAIARSAFVGLRRSSSDLVLELIQFYRTMDAWERNRGADDHKLSWTKVDQCILSQIDTLPPPPSSDRIQFGSNSTGIPP